MAERTVLSCFKLILFGNDCNVKLKKKTLSQIEPLLLKGVFTSPILHFQGTMLLVFQEVFFNQKSRSNMTKYYQIGPNLWPKWPFRIQNNYNIHRQPVLLNMFNLYLKNYSKSSKSGLKECHLLIHNFSSWNDFLKAGTVEADRLDIFSQKETDWCRQPRAPHQDNQDLPKWAAISQKRVHHKFL